MTFTLEAEVRKEGGPSAAALRRAEHVPAVVYGKHKEPISISVPGRAFGKVLREAGESTVVNLTGLGEDLPVLIHEVDLDPVRHAPRHIDFYAITKGEKVEVAVELSFIGESPAVKAGANLVKVLHELEIEADPMNLPHEIEVDLAVLAAVGDQILAKEVKLPSGVELVTEPEEVVALIQEVEAEEEAPAEAADLSSIEVEKKGKEESDEGQEA